MTKYSRASLATTILACLSVWVIGGCTSSVPIGDGLSLVSAPFALYGPGADILLPKMEVKPEEPVTYRYKVKKITSRFSWSLFLHATEDFRVSVDVQVISVKTGTVIHAKSIRDHYSGHFRPEGDAPRGWAADEPVEIVIRLEVTTVGESTRDIQPLKVGGVFSGSP
jgi:hypothetical protein